MFPKITWLLILYRLRAMLNLDAPGRSTVANKPAEINTTLKEDIYDIKSTGLGLPGASKGWRISLRPLMKTLFNIENKFRKMNEMDPLPKDTRWKISLDGRDFAGKNMVHHIQHITMITYMKTLR